VAVPAENDGAEGEHATAKELIAQLSVSDPDDENFDAKVTVLGESVEHCVNEEEGKRYPKARRAVDTKTLGVELADRKKDLEANVDSDEDEQDGPESSAKRPRKQSATARKQFRCSRTPVGIPQAASIKDW
jgi:hypothetical protein